MRICQKCCFIVLFVFFNFVVIVREWGKLFGFEEWTFYSRAILSSRRVGKSFTETGTRLSETETSSKEVTTQF